MQIRFHLLWNRQGSSLKRAFKTSEFQILFERYMKWAGRFIRLSASVGPLYLPSAPSCLWFCHSSRPAKSFSSEDLAHSLDTLQSSGNKEWVIVIGGPDGFSNQEIQRYAPQQLWSFGPLTFPHELAAVIASEQIYRACTILRQHPYHGGH